MKKIVIGLCIVLCLVVGAIFLGGTDILNDHWVRSQSNLVVVEPEGFGPPSFVIQDAQGILHCSVELSGGVKYYGALRDMAELLREEKCSLESIGLGEGVGTPHYTLFISKQGYVVAIEEIHEGIPSQQVVSLRRLDGTVMTSMGEHTYVDDTEYGLELADSEYVSTVLFKIQESRLVAPSFDEQYFVIKNRCTRSESEYVECAYFSLLNREGNVMLADIYEESDRGYTDVVFDEINQGFLFTQADIVSEEENIYGYDYSFLSLKNPEFPAITQLASFRETKFGGEGDACLGGSFEKGRVIVPCSASGGEAVFSLE